MNNDVNRALGRRAESRTVMEAYLTVASILSGFGISVLMFRIQRELHIQEKYPDAPNWLAWADDLVIA